MELTQECIEKIVLAAREVEAGSLTISIKVRPEDKQAFDFRCEYEKHYRVGRTIPTRAPEGRNAPADKF